MHQPDVGVGGPVDHGHPREGNAGTGGGDEVPDDAAHLLVGIAHRQDARAGARAGAGPCSGAEGDPGPVERPAKAWSAGASPVRPTTTLTEPTWASARSRPAPAEVRRWGRWTMTGSMRCSGSRLQRPGGSIEQVVLVVPRRRQELGHPAVDAHHLGCSGRMPRTGPGGGTRPPPPAPGGRRRGPPRWRDGRRQGRTCPEPRPAPGPRHGRPPPPTPDAGRKRRAPCRRGARRGGAR